MAYRSPQFVPDVDVDSAKALLRCRPASASPARGYGVVTVTSGAQGLDKVVEYYVGHWIAGYRVSDNSLLAARPNVREWAAASSPLRSGLAGIDGDSEADRRNTRL